MVGSIYPTKPGVVVVLKEEKRRRRVRGCIKSCLCVAAVALALFAVLALAAYSWTAHRVRDWTVTEPVDLPVKTVPEEELEVFKDEAKLFYDLVKADQLPEDFVATATDLNGLVADSEYLRGNAYWNLSENGVGLSLSLPMNFFPGGGGRFFVADGYLSWDPATSVIHAKMVSKRDVGECLGSALCKPERIALDVELLLRRSANDELDLTVLSGEIFGHTIPQDWIDERENILDFDCDDADDDDCKELRKFIDEVSISLQTHQVVFSAQNHVLEGSQRLLITSGESEAASSKPRGNQWKLPLIRRLAASF